MGSSTLPRLLPIFRPSLVRNPWPYTRRGTGSPALISMAGQYTAWKRRMSLPMMCSEAGQPAEASASGLPPAPSDNRPVWGASGAVMVGGGARVGM